MSEVRKNFLHTHEVRERIINGTRYRFEHSHYRIQLCLEDRNRPTDQDNESCRIDVTRYVPGDRYRWKRVHHLVTVREPEPYQVPIPRRGLSLQAARILLGLVATLWNEGIGADGAVLFPADLSADRAVMEAILRTGPENVTSVVLRKLIETYGKEEAS
jgi:hypothetical protein